MRSLELTLREIHHEQHIGRETESVAELLDGHTCTDNEQVMRHCHTQVYERQAWQRHTCRHRPQRLLQTPLRCGHSSDNTTHGERDDTDCSIDNTHSGRRKRQSSLLGRREKERIHHLQEERLRQTVEQHEHYRNQCSRLLEERDERMSEFRSQG